jgi:hypothetical protein
MQNISIEQEKQISGEPRSKDDKIMVLALFVPINEHVPTRLQHIKIMISLRLQHNSASNKTFLH